MAVAARPDEERNLRMQKPMNDIQPEALIEKMTHDLKALIGERGLHDPVIAGVHTGGVWVAQRLHRMLEVREPLSTLDINFYRDDFSRIGLYPQVKPSAMHSEVSDRHVILVDDVLHTGRTVCAALNEILDYGRAASVVLAVLIDRGGREMPVGADVCGATVALEPGRQIKLRGPDPLSVEILPPGDGRK